LTQYRITTPELVQFHYQVGGLARRGLAFALDQTILILALIGLLWTAAQFGAHVGGVVFLLGKFALDMGYYTFFENRWAGQTPGKRVFKLRVIAAGGGRLTLTDILLRNLVRFIDQPAPYVGVVGGVAAFADPYHRRLGDHAADTLVVLVVKPQLPARLTRDRARVNTFQADAAIRRRILARVTREERDLMLDLMLRRDQLDPDARESLFAQAAEHFRARFALPRDMDHLSDEQAVLNLALVVQEARFGG